MKKFCIIAFTCAIFGNICMGGDVDLSFPDGFKIGAASANYQIEGAWNESGKGENIWDRWTHEHPEAIADGSNGDIAADFYHKYREDVQLIKSVGLNLFRFTISWSRVLPNGMTNQISEEGLQFYKNLTEELVANGIEPIAILYHWDHPQVLEEYGGWTNEQMVDWYVSYAQLIFEALGDSVKIWVTFNEPNLFCSFAYDNGMIQFAPGKNLTGIGKYLCVHNMLKAHAKTYHMYDEKFRATQQGEIGIAPQCTAFLPANDSDTESADTAFQFMCGWIGHPIYHGDYPEIMKTRIAMISEAQGYEKSRLPEFSEEWVSLIKGTVDYFGVNHYSANFVAPDPDDALGIYNSDEGLISSVDPNWAPTSITGLYVVPYGFGELLRQIKDNYDNPPVRVMENGYSDDGALKDYKRIQFHHDYLKEMLKAVKEDGCDVRSYMIWTLMDDFEWNSGYPPKFGIYRVDFNDTSKKRTARLSASWWKKVIETHYLQPVPTSSDK